jgi:6-pyruvoyltetrahydropterin/6-carboxytetrahydropterin synthase
MVYLTRRYRLSAAHRLHNDALSEAENARLYGKCNNPRGHGHDYQLEVTVSGELDPRTGMVMDLRLLDGVVQREILDRFDHTHLNLDVDNFRAQVPTTENLCIEIYRLLASGLAAAGNAGPAGARLKRVRVEETRNNFFEYEGPSSLQEQS